MISIGEGSIDIPSHWHNASVNIFSSNPEGGLNITINRDQLSGQSSLHDYASLQIEMVSQQLAQFKLLHQQTLTLGQASAASPANTAILFEFSWHSPQLGLVHQIIMCAAQGRQVLNFTGSQPGMMDASERQTILAALGSFVFQR